MSGPRSHERTRALKKAILGVVAQQATFMRSGSTRSAGVNSHERTRGPATERVACALERRGESASASSLEASVGWERSAGGARSTGAALRAVGRWLLDGHRCETLLT